MKTVKLIKQKVSFIVESEQGITGEDLDGCWITDDEFPGAISQFKIVKLKPTKIRG